MEGARTPLITAVIGTWNRADRVGEAIASLLSQTVEDLELIVADDGSTDDTESVVKSFGDPRVRWLAGPHQGISANLNRALEAARTEVVALLDSDDRALPTRLERQLELMRSRPEVAVTGFRMTEEDELGRALAPRTTFAAGDVNEALMRFNPISNSCAALRRETVLATGGYSTRYRCAVDWDLWLRVADRHVVHCLDETLGVRRMHADNLSIRSERAQIRAGLRTRLETARRRRSPHGLSGLAPAALSLVTPVALKRERRRRLGQAA